MSETTIDRIAAILGRKPIAEAVYQAISAGVESADVHLVRGNSVWSVFEYSLDAAIRDIEQHPRGKLFRRLIEFGPHHPDVPRVLTSDGKTTLSDPECGLAVNFVFFHMVNRFKGELAELLSIEPCLALMKELQEEGNVARDVQLFLGEIIEERGRKTGSRGYTSFTKGADGLLACRQNEPRPDSSESVAVAGIVEVKSMRVAKKTVFKQIRRHLVRLRGGLRLHEHEFKPNQVSANASQLLRIMVVPSTWRLDRRWRRRKTGTGSALDFWELEETPTQTKKERLGSKDWKITLAWSEEALEQAAYEMTYWYMSQVGEHVYSRKELPKEWEGMTPKGAGFNAIKMMLYYFPLRPLSTRKKLRALKLYNVYSFGYPNGVDSKRMLWAEDFASYQITEPVLEKLGAARLPGEIIAHLARLLQQSFIGAENFRKCLRKTIGNEATKKYEALILKHAEFFPDDN